MKNSKKEARYRERSATSVPIRCIQCYSYSAFARHIVSTVIFISHHHSNLMILSNLIISTVIFIHHRHHHQCNFNVIISNVIFISNHHHHQCHRNVISILSSALSFFMILILSSALSFWSY